MCVCEREDSPHFKSNISKQVQSVGEIMHAATEQEQLKRRAEMDCKIWGTHSFIHATPTMVRRWRSVPLAHLGCVDGGHRGIMKGSLLGVFVDHRPGEKGFGLQTLKLMERAGGRLKEGIWLGIRRSRGRKVLSPIPSLHLSHSSCARAHV